MRVSKTTWPALALSFLLLFPALLSNNAFSHGDNPSICENRYDATITSMTINNGTQTFDPISNWDVEFDAQIGKGYDVAFTLHTANASSQNNTLAGTTWYNNYAFGFGSGRCVDDAGPDQDIPLTGHVDMSRSGVPDGYTQSGVEWGSWPDTSQARYNVVWHFASDPEEEEPPEEQPQPPQDDDQDADEPTDPEPDEDNQTDDEPEPDDSPVGTIVSPFIFRDETTTASEQEEETSDTELLQENVDILEINGTLASLHFMDGMRLYVVSGNWSMIMNDTAVVDFGANFTVAPAGGLGRQEYSLGNLTAVNDSDLLLANGTMALSSALDYRYPNGTITRVNATITLEKMNVIKIELDGMRAPIYGVFDKVVRHVNGETQVMARQFDMI